MFDRQLFSSYVRSAIAFAALVGVPGCGSSSKAGGLNVVIAPAEEALEDRSLRGWGCRA